jgi:hypothetical protein
MTVWQLVRCFYRRRMRLKVAVVLAFLGVIVSLPLLAWSAETGKRWTWDFETDAVGRAPAGFSFERTGSGRPGRWSVVVDKDDSRAGRVLSQLDDDSTSYRFPVAIAETVSLRDLRLTVRCKPVSGKVDQACGLVFRHQDQNNYYVVRANALENNVRLYYVKNGNRQQFAGWDGPVASGVWHEITVQAQGERFEVYWNGQKIITAADKNFLNPGKIGMWTKADSVTYFDDLRVDALER